MDRIKIFSLSVVHHQLCTITRTPHCLIFADDYSFDTCSKHHLQCFHRLPHISLKKKQPIESSEESLFKLLCQNQHDQLSYSSAYFTMKPHIVIVLPMNKQMEHRLKFVIRCSIKISQTPYASLALMNIHRYVSLLDYRYPFIVCFGGLAFQSFLVVFRV